MKTITANTTDLEITKASKTEIIMCLFKGTSAVLRKSRLAQWSKAEAIQEAITYRNKISAK